MLQKRHIWGSHSDVKKIQVRQHMTKNPLVNKITDVSEVIVNSTLRVQEPWSNHH
jgi:hypothetical protein